jgi:hypothetical protein
MDMKLGLTLIEEHRLRLFEMECCEEYMGIKVG